MSTSHAALIAEAQQSLKVGNLAAAERACNAVLKESPEDPEALLALARLRVMAGLFVGAEDAFRRLEEVRPGDPQAAIQRGHFLMRLGRDSQAIAQFRIASAALPREDEPKVMIASCERRRGNPALALDLLAGLPRSATAMMVAAAALLDLDRPEQAEAVLVPFTGLPLSPVARSQLLHLLGQAQERQGRFEDAVGSYAASKGAVAVKFDPELYLQRVGSLRERFATAALSRLARSRNGSERPVFVAGMPRSGTTLLERIVAAHAEASGAGETDALRRQILRLDPADSTGALIEALPTMTSAELDQIAWRYLEVTTPFGPTAARIVDKHLDNWIFLGFISLLFPRARAIHIRRDPEDIGISCFERLNPIAAPWSADLRNLGRVIRECELTMEFWKRNLGIQILTVDYEALVRDPEPHTRRVISFLGLSWDDACLAHHSGDQRARLRPPPTLASEQAARPIYDSSIGRAARFGAALAPLREALRER